MPCLWHTAARRFQRDRAGPSRLTATRPRRARPKVTGVPLLGEIVLICGVASIVAVAVHMLGLRGALALHARTSRWPRLAVGSLVLTALGLHVLEIGLYAWLLDVLLNTGRFGSLQGAGDDPAFATVFYFAAVAYTTLGFGDILPLGAMRLITIVLPLTGMILVAFSASVIILAVQRSWSVRVLNSTGATTPTSER